MQRSSFTLEQVRSFVAVAEHEHVSRAASSLFLTQAAVTQQLHHFEAALGVQLFERAGRGIRLTDAGRSLVESCRAAMRSIEVVGETAEGLKQLETGTLHLGASPTSATYYLPAHLAEFSRRNPAIKLNMAVETSADLNRLVRSGALDCAVIEGAADADLTQFELARDELVLVVHSDHPLAHLRTVKRSDLAAHRYLGRGPQWSTERYAREMIGEAYASAESLNLGHPEYVRAAAVAGLGYAVLSKRSVASELHAGILKRLPPAPYVRPITAIRRPGRGAPVQEAFWDQLTGGASLASSKIFRDGERDA